MGWKITFVADDPDNEKAVDLDDLSPDVFDAIAAEEGMANWWSVYTFPGESFDRMYRVICACADSAGIPHPERAQTMRGADALVSMLTRTTDIEETPMADGFPPVPDATEVSSSSGAPGDSTGPPTSPEASPLEIS